MRLYILDNGWMECDENWIVCLKNYATKDNRERSSRWIKLPVYCVLLETEKGKLLYDAGQSPTEYDRSKRFPYYFRDSQRLEQQLLKTGTKPEDINMVVLSHLHDDHCGNLPLFPNADIYIAENEFNYVKQARDRNEKPVGAYNLIQLDYPNIHLVNSDIELTKGVTLINLSGHSCGLLGMIVELEKEGTIIFTGDSVDTKDNFGPPAMPQASEYDLKSYYESIDKVRRLQKRYGAEVFFSHDWEQFEGMRKAPEYYE